MPSSIKTVSSEQEKKQIEELKTKIKNLKQETCPKECQGIIRALFKKISRISKENVKGELDFELRAASRRGLNSDLKKLVEENGLSMEALDLVLKYLTTMEEVAQYFFTHPKSDDEGDGFVALRRRLGPRLEVLGGLCAKGIDVRKDWVTKLVKEAPSFQSLARMSVHELEKLCKGASHGEREDVNNLVKIAQARIKQIAAAHDVQKVGAKEGGEKAIDQEKIDKAKALMNEAKELAKQQSEEAKKAVNVKVAEITKILKLPPDWNKQDIGLKPEQLFGQLDGIIEQLDSVVEAGEAYKSDLEVVRKASGGRALCGIYHSEYAPPITAELTLIVMPSELILTSPNNSKQVRYLKFSKSRAAANYVQAVKSSSSNIGLSVGGFIKLFVGDVNGSYATSSGEENTTSEKRQTTNASVVQYFWIATKTFKIGDQQLELSANAKKMARTVVNEETARLFMQRYGSHFPAGLHTLGGVLFRIVDAESSSAKATSVLTEKAAQQLQGQISVGVLGGLFGIGASISGEHSSSSGKTEGHDEQAEDVSYTFSSQAMGPATTNPAAFCKLLANNSTWALIDRGSSNAYLPIWELLQDLGSDFEEAARILEYTWRKDEAERKEKIIKVKRCKDIQDLRSKIYQTSVYVMKITNFNQKLSAAKDSNTTGDVYGDPFFTSTVGYKVMLKVTLNETRRKYGKDIMGAYLVIMESDHDAILPWPFKKKYTFTLIDQEQDEDKRKNIEKTLTPDGRGYFKKPEMTQNKGFGCGFGFPSLVSHEKLKTCNYIVDDTVFIKVEVQQ